MTFTGQLFDPTGFYHLRAREYDPETGRFVQRDPAPATTTQPYISSFAYAGDQPAVLIDPTKQFFESATDGQDRARSTASPDPAVYLAAQPPPGYVIIPRRLSA